MCHSSSRQNSNIQFTRWGIIIKYRKLLTKERERAIVVITIKYTNASQKLNSGTVLARKINLT